MDHLLRLGQAEMFLQNWNKAITLFEDFIEQVGRDRLSRIQYSYRWFGDLMACYAYVGDKSKLRLLQNEGFWPSSNRPGVQNIYYKARVQTILGGHDAAIESLAFAIQEGWNFNDWSYAFDYHFRPLFDDPRFQQLVSPKG